MAPQPAAGQDAPKKKQYGLKTTKFVNSMRKIYHPLGFKKGYNFPLFIIFAGAMLGFVCARFMYFNVTGNQWWTFKKGSSPGEWYHYKDGHYRIGIIMHLATCLPAGFLMIFQFVPIIRHKFILFHRINGYIIVTLVLITLAAALMIARRAFGGSLDTQAAVGLLAMMITGALGMAYYNIKRLQIDQHRAWMLRAMFYLGTIISERLIQLASARCITRFHDYYQLQTCGEIAFNFGGQIPPPFQAIYPQCTNGTPGTYVAVMANDKGLPEQVGAALGLSFSMALWLAMFLHLVGVEIYLNLTPAEGERLRTVSYERQL